MRLTRTFEEFVSEGVVNKRKSDVLRAKSLIEESDRDYKFSKMILSSIGFRYESMNYFVVSSYDILIKLIRARFIIDGFFSSGEGAHEAEISYMRKLGFSEKETLIMNDLRYHRNGIQYYGKSFDENYARKVLEFLDRMYPILKNIAGKM